MKFVMQYRLVLTVLFLFFVPGLNSWADDLTPDVTAKKTRPVHDYANLETHTDITIENSSKKTIVGPMRLVIDSISRDDITVANPDGKLPDGRAYFNYHHSSKRRHTKPGEKSFSRKIRFHNPKGAQFDFKVKVEGKCKNRSNTPPTANAGPDQTVFVMDTVYLDGSASSDVDGDSITYSWRFTAMPPGSTAALSDPTIVNPSFEVDVPGTYSVQLVVNDGKADSKPDIVNINTENSPPVAIAGADQTVLVGRTVALDGSSSTDVDGDPLTYNWSITSMPVGSTAVLSDPSAVSPSFTVDAPGIYTVQLIVNDGMVNSEPDSVDISTDNSVPIADAGPDQTALVGETVTLDGSGSSDADGDSLMFTWALTSVPSGSAAVISDVTAVNPTFDIDLPGTYVAQLIVNDGMADSAADSVRITTENTPPVANAGPNQTVLVGDTVTLDGSNSSDVDGDLLTFSWSFTSLPPGSIAMLSDNTAVMPTFNVDVYGTYVLQLMVNDGTVNSAADTVTIITENTAPVANAGTDQTVLVGDTVVLNGSGSSDADGDGLTYTWSFVSKPAGSTAVLSDANAVSPGFFVDEAGSYVLQLVVNDGIVNSAPDTMTITTENSPPVANAGSDQSVLVGDTVILDGSGSNDVDGDTLTYAWSFVSLPSASLASLSDATMVDSSFTVDVAGTYVVQLIVNDGTVDSAPDSMVVITVNEPPVANAGPNQIVNIGDTVTLDGSGSSDPDGQSLSYSWSMTSRPVDSNAILSDPTAISSTFVADVLGDYVFELMVNDGYLDSAVSSVTITASQAGITLTLIDTALVGVGRPAQVGVTLSNPAPAGGVTVTVSSDNTGTLVVESPVTTFIAEGDTEGQVTVTGITEGFTILRGGAAGYSEGTLEVGVTLNLISVPTTLNVPLGQTVSLPVSIAPDPAPPGGIVVELVSSDPATAQLQSTTVIIPEGAHSANTTITGHMAGSVTVNASNPDYAADFADVSITAELNIVPASVAFSAGFPVDITVRLQSMGGDVTAPAPVTVTLTPADPECVSVTSPVTIETGFVTATATVSYQGIATLPCNTTVLASSPNITSDTIDVAVNLSPELSIYNQTSTVGAGLMLSNNSNWVVLGTADHGGVTVRLQSSDPTIALVAPDGNTAGTEYIDVFVPDGVNTFYFVAQGFEGATTLATATLTVSAPGFTSGTAVVNVVQPALRISGLAATTTTLSLDDPFTVDVGIPDSGNSNVSVQRVRTGGGAVNAVVASNVSSVGQLVTTGSSGASVSVAIQPGTSSSPGTVMAGGVAFDPLGVGQTSVSATIPGFITTAAGSVNVNVSAPELGFYSDAVTVGAGLMLSDTSNWVTLGATGHGGVTVRVQSSDPTIALVAPDGNSAGTEYIDLVVPDGQNFVYFVTQGFEGASTPATATLTVSAPGFTSSASVVVNVVQPAVRISGLNATSTTLSADDPFTVNVGIPTTGNTNLSVQRVRSGAGALTAFIASSEPAVGQLVTTGSSGGSVTVEIQPGSASSSSTVATGGVAFDSLGGGNTIVAAAIPGFITTSLSSVGVNVSTPAVGFFYGTSTVGAGLMLANNSNWVTLGATDHGGVTVRVQSSDATIALVAPDGNTAGTEYIDVFVPDGQNYFYFVTQGSEGAATPATATFTVSAPGFISGTMTVNVVQPALRINGLDTATTTLSPNDPFTVDVGIPTAGNANVSLQRVRSGASVLTAIVDSSLPNIGRLATSAVTGASVSVDIQPGSTSSASTVATGGAAFDPLTTGDTVVEATIPGYITTTAGSVNVTVSAPELSFYYSGVTVGAGLMLGSSSNRVTLGATNHGGVTVRVRSSNPAIALVAPDASTPGTEYIDVFVPNGVNYFYFVTQGFEGASTPASVGLIASADGFIDGTTTVNVVQPAVQISSLNANTAVSSVDDPFIVQVGIPISGNTSVSVQRVRTGASALTAIVQSSEPSVGTLVTAAFSGAAVDVQIQPGQYFSPLTVASGGVALDPLNIGVTTVSATIPGFITTTNGSVDVTVTETLLQAVSAANDKAVAEESGGGGAFDPYLLLIGMSYLILINKRRRRIR